jgi:hypothetical protein
MSRPRCYVAAPHQLFAEVREVHARLIEFGWEPTSSWVDDVTGPEDLTRYSTAELRAMIVKNDRAIESSSAMIVLSRAGLGAEMFAEARLASSRSLPTIWGGDRRPLGAYRENVISHVRGVDQALDELQRLRRRLRRA